MPPSYKKFSRQQRVATALAFAAIAIFTQIALGAPTTSSTVELIMKKVQDQESWIDTVESLYVAYDVKWVNSPETLAERLKQWKKRNPQQEPDPKKYWDLRPEQDQTEVWAFDKTRIAVRKSAPDTLLDHRSWDGKIGIIHEQYFPLNQEQYTLFKDPAFEIVHAVDPFYFRVFFHDFWWLPASQARKKTSSEWEYPSLKDFELTGEELLDGAKCWKVSFPRRNIVYWVDKNSGHLTKMVRLAFSPPADKRSEVQEKITQAWLLMLKKKGHEFKDVSEIKDWLKTLPLAEQKKTLDEILASSQTIAAPFLEVETEDCFKDYREVSPGCWHPMSGEFTVHSNTTEGKRYVAAHQTIKVVEVRVNKPIPDDLLRIDMKEGAQVYDFRYDPPLEYKYKKDRTEAEWEELKKAAQARAAKPSQQ
jgi:hypothetical protein